MSKPLSFTSPEELQKKIDEYFLQCDASRKELQLKNGDVKIRYEHPPTVIGLCVFLGCSKETFYRWMNKEDIEGITKLDEYTKNQISDCLIRARDRIEVTTLERSASGDYDAKISTIILNGFGYNFKDESSNIVVIKVAGADGKDINDWSR